MVQKMVRNIVPPVPKRTLCSDEGDFCQPILVEGSALFFERCWVLFYYSSSKRLLSVATYVIGDVQGCFFTLEELLKRIKFDHSKDRAIFLGDVINRGANSLEVMRLIYKNPDSMSMVLGNHEIFAIALYLDAIKESRPHTLQALFSTDDAPELMEWLRNRPLMMQINNNIFVHAGILPAISVHEALNHAESIHQKLKGPNAKKFLSRHFEKRPVNLKACDTPKKLLRMALSYLTLMRMCENKNAIDPNYTGGLLKAPPHLKPWFMLRDAEPYFIYFGHWAALGFFHHKNFMCLDSGCAWGNQLSAWHIEEHKLIQVDNCEPK